MGQENCLLVSREAFPLPRALGLLADLGHCQGHCEPATARWVIRKSEQNTRAAPMTMAVSSWHPCLNPNTNEAMCLLGINVETPVLIWMCSEKNKHILAKASENKFRYRLSLLGQRLQVGTWRLTKGQCIPLMSPEAGELLSALAAGMLHRGRVDITTLQIPSEVNILIMASEMDRACPLQVSSRDRSVNPCPGMFPRHWPTSSHTPTLDCRNHANYASLNSHYLFF